MHTDFEKIIQDKGEARRNKDPLTHIREYLGGIRLVAEHVPGPEKKYHGGYIRDNPFSLCMQIYRLSETQTPQQQNNQKREYKCIVGKSQQFEQLTLLTDSQKISRMHID